MNDALAEFGTCQLAAVIYILLYTKLTGCMYSVRVHHFDLYLTNLLAFNDEISDL
jgi:hypothetical protein